LVKNKFPQLPHSSGTGSNLIGHQKSHCMPWVALYVDQLRMYRYVLNKLLLDRLLGKIIIATTKLSIRFTFFF